MHRLSALPLLLFVLPHMLNVVASLGGAEVYRAMLAALRTVYRVPAVEALLLAVVACHLASGMHLLWRRRGPRLQRASGACLLLFLPIHVVGVLVARGRYGLETGFEFAASGLHLAGMWAFFAPYYLLAAAALAIHLGGALAARSSLCRRASARRIVLGVAALLGLASGVAVVAALSGSLYPVSVPAAFRVLYP